MLSASRLHYGNHTKAVETSRIWCHRKSLFRGLIADTGGSFVFVNETIIHDPLIEKILSVLMSPRDFESQYTLTVRTVAKAACLSS